MDSLTDFIWSMTINHLYIFIANQWQNFMLLVLIKKEIRFPKAILFWTGKKKRFKGKQSLQSYNHQRIRFLENLSIERIGHPWSRFQIHQNFRTLNACTKLPKNSLPGTSEIFLNLTTIDRYLQCRKIMKGNGVCVCVWMCTTLIRVEADIKPSQKSDYSKRYCRKLAVYILFYVGFLYKFSYIFGYKFMDKWEVHNVK